MVTCLDSDRAMSDETALMFFAFDLLHQDGVDLRHLPLSERKRDVQGVDKDEVSAVAQGQCRAASAVRDRTLTRRARRALAPACPSGYGATVALRTFAISIAWLFLRGSPAKKSRHLQGLLGFFRVG